MKVGAENKRQVIILIVLMVIAALSLGMSLTLGRPQASTAATPSPAPPPATAQTPAQQGGRRRASRRQVTLLAPSEDPRLRLDLLKSAENTRYEGNGRNIFRDYEPPPPPVISPAKQAKQNPPPGPPPPPPINLKFFGFASKPGEPKRVFLAQGDDVFIAGEGDIVNRRYRVLRIQPNAVEVEDVLNNNRQMLPLNQS